jgi:hypothetical protein
MRQSAKGKANVAGTRTVKLKSGARVSKSDAARRLASAIEGHMSDLELSEQEKNRRVARFSDRVASAVARSAKP